MNAPFPGAVVRVAGPRAADMIRLNIAANDEWLARALLALYARQTADERDADETRHDNGRGFNSADARVLSKYARWAQEWDREGPLFRWPSKREDAVRRLQKYCRQLASLIAAPVDEPEATWPWVRVTPSSWVAEASDLGDSRIGPRGQMLPDRASSVDRDPDGDVRAWHYDLANGEEASVIDD